MAKEGEVGEDRGSDWWSGKAREVGRYKGSKQRHGKWVETGSDR